MTKKSTFRELFASARVSIAYKVERAIIAFTEQVIGKMEAGELSRAAFAAKLQASPAYVTKFLRGGTNFTMESMVKVADALDCDLKVELVSKSSPIDWFRRWENNRPKERAEIRFWTHMKTAVVAQRGSMGHISCPLPPQHLYQQDNPQDNF